ncbi:anthranilate synthase component I family protein [Bacillus sp. A116_S68]|nr:anthranilate synthase component I family protein [Bacillus sp. A116_S68]
MSAISYKAIGDTVRLSTVAGDWFNTYMKLAQGEKNHVLLESGRGGRYSIIGVSPWAIIKGKDYLLTIETKEGISEKQGPLLSSLREWLSSYKLNTDDTLPDFQGGVIGQLSYDLVRQIENLPNLAKDDLATDDLYLLAFDEVYVIDHQTEELWLIAIVPCEREEAAEGKLRTMRERWLGAAEESEGGHLFVREPYTFTISEVSCPIPERSFQESEFIEAVEKTKQYIREGDVFQVNLSVRESKRALSEPLHMYHCLRQVNPSPYMGFMSTEHVQYVSASPELLVKVKGSTVSTRPIAGTRSRGANDQEDQALANTLLQNEKERAEHIMLVDLERNDLGRVCNYGSVEVNELMVIEKYSHVMHIVSNVRGIKSPEHDALDVVAATFPGGTITGAPKVRTMEIIEELEPVRRGAYTGAFGWIGFNGDMELNITIRTMIVKDGLVHVQAGAGIVIDSQPAAEYKEALKKAKALWQAKEMSEEEIELRRNK